MPGGAAPWPPRRSEREITRHSGATASKKGRENLTNDADCYPRRYPGEMQGVSHAELNHPKSLILLWCLLRDSNP